MPTEELPWNGQKEVYYTDSNDEEVSCVCGGGGGGGGRRGFYSDRLLLTWDAFAKRKCWKIYTPYEGEI